MGREVLELSRSVRKQGCRFFSRSIVTCPCTSIRKSTISRPSSSFACYTTNEGPSITYLPNSVTRQIAQVTQRASRSVICRATLDDPELEEMVHRMEELRPCPPAQREKLEKAVKLIDDINVNDPSKVTLEDGIPRPYRLIYSDWVLSWVKKLDNKASDELIILAKGRNVESWKLSDIKRDDYSPNSGGMKLWEQDRKVWLADRLEAVMKEAGYEGEPLRAVREVMLQRNVPDPKDIRKFDLIGALGAINYKLLEEAKMIQTLRDADALVFMEKNFPQMADRMGSEEVLMLLRKELGGISRQCTSVLLGMPHWSAVKLKMITKALPPPSKRLRSIMLEAEGTAASSTHPGDWRYKDFSYD